MEAAARPQLDASLLGWITRQPLKREWVFGTAGQGLPTHGPLAPRRPKLCQVCGAEGVQNRYCRSCAVEVSRENMAQVALIGHAKTKPSKVRASISKTLNDQSAAGVPKHPTFQEGRREGYRQVDSPPGPNSPDWRPGRTRKPEYIVHRRCWVMYRF